MTDLYHRFDGYEPIKDILDGSDEDVLVALRGKPALVRIPALDARGGTLSRARMVACLLHGNEDSGYRAALDLLRTGARWPFDLWVLIGNVRAASQEGWFAHRYLDDQEDFNRVWGLGQPTTRMRRCADAILEVLAEVDLEAVVDLHNNTGDNPYYAIVPQPTPEALNLAAVCSDTVLYWGRQAHTLMEALIDRCPAIAVECGLPGIAANTEFAAEALQRFLTADPGAFTQGRRLTGRHAVYELVARVEVRPEVPFAFGGQLTEELDLVLRPGLDGANFGMLLAGTELGQVHAGAAMPLCVTDMRGHDVTSRYLDVCGDGRLVVTEDLTPAMMVTTVAQTRRDCLFYVARRRA